jgi:DNA-3-methyladenine glycosylase I
MGSGAPTDGLQRHEDGLTRCWWCGDDTQYVAYHDREWGLPVHDEIRLFEKLCLEGFQAGLSWLTILRKREAFRAGFAGFDPERVAGFGDREVTRLLADAGIVRHRGKIEAAISNARAYLHLVDEAGSLDEVVWSFAPETHPVPQRLEDVPAITTEATALSRELKRRGFRFVGPTTSYAFMQSMGIVNDHLADCAFRDAVNGPAEPLSPAAAIAAR